MEQREIEVLTLFTPTDDYREWLKRPIEVGEFIAATDGHTIAAIRKTSIEGQYDKANESPGQVMLDLLSKPQNINIEIAASQLKEVLNKAKTSEQYDTTECDECDGDGFQECNLGHEHKCEECNGKGEFESPSPNGKLWFPAKSFVKLNTHYLKSAFIDRISKAAEILGVNSIQFTYEGEANEPVGVTVGEMRFIIMPVMYQKECGDQIIHLLENGIITTPAP